MFKRVFSWICVVWAVALVFYFSYREGLINWTWLEQPPATTALNTEREPTRDEIRAAHVRGLLDPRFEPSSHRGAYTAVLKGVSGTYRVHWDNIPWPDLGWSFLMLFLYLGLGKILLGGFEVFFTRTANECMAFVLGCGAAGVAFELLTLAGLLNQTGVLITWVLLFALAFVFLEYRLRARTRRSSSVNVWQSHKVYNRLAHEWAEKSTIPLHGTFERVYYIAAVTVISIISLLILLHAIALPESYWDSLILYMGYARKMFLEQGFPTKIVGQVGIGLGANYPHLYPLLTAQTAAVAGHWNDVFAQLLPPFSAVVTTFIVYSMALDLTRNRLIAVSATLLFRAVPYGIIYHTYASDYAVAILFTAAFLYAAQKYIVHGLPDYFALALLFAAFAVHVNYLMWVLWITAAVVFVVAHARNERRREPLRIEAPDDLEPPRVQEMKEPFFLTPEFRPGLRIAFLERQFLAPVLVAAAIASPWYLRNIVLTGNPVYAFFHNIFPSKNVNPDVMKSAEFEWLMNGDGIGRVGTTLTEKLQNSWLYFVTGDQHWKLSPVFMAFVVPGFLTCIALLLVAAFRRRMDDTLRVAIPCAFLFLLLWFYEYCIADFYLYQIIIVLPLFAVFIALLLQACSSPSARRAFYGLCLFVGFSPGIIVGLMGFKLKNTGVYTGMPAPQFNLTALKNLFMSPQVFYNMEFNGDMAMFGRLTMLPKGTRVLTHENRHLLLDERLDIVHLDDWAVQKAYGKPAAERVRILDQLRLKHYLYMPNEDKHVANSWLGMDELIGLGYYVEEYQTNSSGHTPREVLHENIPRDKNVLYKRTDKLPG